MCFYNIYEMCCWFFFYFYFIVFVKSGIDDCCFFYVDIIIIFMFCVCGFIVWSLKSYFVFKKKGGKNVLSVFVFVMCIKLR